uniref:Uncharacterized protein n=1 Tax=Nelumbo nucifera TaxID=4432 RepID=A0A822Z2M5_NELNU|nr:TPA_asm: hypothetical protein HUJ06_013262 [Nelumbo nucifera]
MVISCSHGAPNNQKQSPFSSFMFAEEMVLTIAPP